MYFTTVRIQGTVPGRQRCEEDKGKDVLRWSEVPGFALQGDGETQTGGVTAPLAYKHTLELRLPLWPSY